MDRQLEYFLAIVKYGNFSKAAEHCCIEQSTLSTQIKKLENELNIVLFDRSQKPIRLTKHEKKIVSKAQKVVDNIIKIRKIASEYSN